jgi:glycosyltransferase involved in cell wall biosynthesis
MTCYNEVMTVRESLNSLLGQLDEDYEVVIVDNFSEDGTYEILKEFESSHGVKLVRRRCSRGLGRQTALENANGDYIIANLDLDDVFMPVFREILTNYHRKFEGNMLAIFNSVPPPSMTGGWVQNMTIGPRNLIAEVGGWRDLNLFEDWDIWNRADKVHKYRWTSRKFAMNETYHPERASAFGRLRQRYERYRIRLRLGMKIFGPGETVGLSQRLAYIAARSSMAFGGVLEGQDPEFRSLDLRLFVDLAADSALTEEHSPGPGL